jgi:RNA polymerase sigma factor (sigma-70 family)
MTQSPLLARYATQKDADAFAQIVTQYQGLVFATCRRALSNREDADDAVQETFLRLAQKASSLRGNLGAWLHTCAVNIAIDMNRRRRTRSRYESAVTHQPDLDNDSQRILAELREHLDAAMQKLPAADRELIIQRFFVGRQQIDLAKEAGVAPSTINHRLDRAIEALRGNLKTLGCAVAAATLIPLLQAEHASASVPAALTANIMKIGLTGVSGAATTLSAPALVASLLLGLAALTSLGIWLFTVLDSTQAQQTASTSQPAPALHGRVLFANGQPVIGATVFVALPQRSRIQIRNGALDIDDPQTPRAQTDSDGAFDLLRQSSPFLLQVISDAGYAQVDQDTFKKNPDIHLLDWGQIQGRYLLGTKPASRIEFQTISLDQTSNKGPIPIPITNSATSDPDGNFTMDHVLPGQVLIYRNFEEQSGPISMNFRDDVGVAHVIAAQTTTLAFGGVGRPVTGKFVFPPNLNPNDYFINARAFPIKRNLDLSDNHFLEVAPDLTFQINNIPPGDYRVHIFLQKVHGDRAAQSTEPQFTMPPIPNNVSDDPLIIPDIQLK